MPGAVVRAVLLSHQVVGSKQPLRRFCGGNTCLGFFLPQTSLMWEPPALDLPFSIDRLTWGLNSGVTREHRSQIQMRLVGYEAVPVFLVHLTRDLFIFYSIFFYTEGGGDLLKTLNE